MDKSSFKKNFSLPIINLSKVFFNLNKFQNSQKIIQLYTYYKNDLKRNTININTSSKLKKIKPKLKNNTLSLLFKSNIKNILMNYEKSAKKVRLLTDFFSDNFFTKRLSSI